MMNENLSPAQAVIPRRRQRRSGLGTGTTSLLMIFTLLCLATLALLSLSTAHSDQRIKQRAITSAQDMLAAEGEAAYALAEIDMILIATEATYTVTSQSAYYAQASAALREAGYHASTSREGATTVAFAVPLGDESVLETTLLLLSPGESQRYRVLSQVAVSTLDWQPEGGAVWLPDAA